MATLKTQPHDGDVEAFLATIADDEQRQDVQALRQIMAEVTGDDGSMWGDAIVGFGSYHYRYDSGREGDWFEVGFSPRKRNLSVYIMAGFDGHGRLLERLGKHSTGKSCLYINRLADVDVDILRELVGASVEHIRRVYPS